MQQSIAEDVDSADARILKLENEIAALKARNYRVERNKSWETSRTRFACIAVLTYLTMNLLLWTIGGPFPPVHALVPTAGFMLSTLSLPRIKEWWIQKYLS